MLTIETALTFFGVSVLLGLSPGPDNVFVLMQSVTFGRRAGWLVTLGLCTGLLGHTAAVALGLAAVLAASPIAFTVLKLAGAAYLIYLAWGAWHAPVSALSAEATAGSCWRMYTRGVVMNLTNPKVGIFFLAFLPQFVQPEAGAVTQQVVQLGGLFVLATLLVFVAPPLLLALSALGRWRHARYLSSVAALGWFSHGVMRAWTDRPDNAPAWAALLLALLIIALASGRSARARLASRRKPTAH